MLLVTGDEQDVGACHGEKLQQTGDNISMEQSPDAPQEKKRENDKRSALQRHVGRRTSDWVMPVLFWLIGFSAILVAWHFYQRNLELEALNATYKEQILLLEREHKK